MTKLRELRLFLIGVIVGLLFANATDAFRGLRPPSSVTACGTPVVQYVVIQAHGYTDSEAALRATARRGYTVGKVRYARNVHGLVSRRYRSAL